MCRKKWLSTLVLLAMPAAAAVSEAASVGFHVGLDYLDQEHTYQDPFRTETLGPVWLTDPDAAFVADGGLAGWSEADARRAVTLATDAIFRAVDVGDPDRTLAIAIHHGRVPTDRPGRRLNTIMGNAEGSHSFFGVAPLNAWNLPNHFPDDSDAGIVYPDNIARMAEIIDYPVAFDTSAKVIDAISGITAHEIGHLFDLRHVDRGEEQPFAIMSTGGWGMSGDDWLTRRAFSDEPDTQTDGHSSISYLIDQSATTWRADFTLDGTVGADDFEVLAANWGRKDALWHEGDASGNHQVGADDFELLAANWGRSNSVPEPATMGLLALGGFAMVIRRRRPALRTASDVTHCISPIPQRTGFAHNLKHRGVASGCSGRDMRVFRAWTGYWIPGGRRMRTLVIAVSLVAGFFTASAPAGGTAVWGDGIADLIYLPDTGEVILWPEDAPGGFVLNYVLQRDDGGFREENAVFPDGKESGNVGALAIDTEISWTDVDYVEQGAPAVLTATFNAGAVLPAGLTESELADWFSRSTFVGSLGTGEGDWNLSHGYAHVINDVTMSITGGAKVVGSITGTGTLEIGEAATVRLSGDLDNLSSAGSATIEGVLDVDVSGIVLGGTDVFEVRDLIKDEHIVSTTAAGQSGYAVGYGGAGNGEVKVMYARLGDATLDRTVGADDFDVLSANWTAGADEGKTWQEADFTGDGAVGADDFEALSTNWGASASSGDKAITEAQLAEMSASLLESDGEVHLSFTDSASWRVYIGDADGEVLDGTNLLLNADGYPITDAHADDVNWLADPFSLTEIADGTYVFEGVGDNILSADDDATNIWADLEGIAAGGDDVRLWVRCGRQGETLQNEWLYIPEPATMGLLALGGLGVLLRRRRS